MRFTALSIAALGVIGCFAILANVPRGAGLDLIDRLNAAIQLRFFDPAPASLGMSRMARPSSFGRHYAPSPGAATDFRPENAAERDLVGELEARQFQVGVYLFGPAITESQPDDLNFRALKGPAIVTSGTPRPLWYPLKPVSTAEDPDALPDWRAIYPLARQAMQRFAEGGERFETVSGGWEIAVRPVIASQLRCVTCHNNSAYKPTHVSKLNDPFGGVIYAYRLRVN